jgi:hypothetical protein
VSTPGQRRSRKQERNGAKEFGGKLTPGSGNGWVTKNDMTTRYHSFEYKTTHSRSYSLRLDVLQTVERNALLDGREPVLLIDLAGHEYAVITKDHFRELTGQE